MEKSLEDRISEAKAFTEREEDSIRHYTHMMLKGVKLLLKEHGHCQTLDRKSLQAARNELEWWGRGRKHLRERRFNKAVELIRSTIAECTNEHFRWQAWCIVDCATAIEEATGVRWHYMTDGCRKKRLAHARIHLDEMLSFAFDRQLPLWEEREEEEEVLDCAGISVRTKLVPAPRHHRV